MLSYETFLEALNTMKEKRAQSNKLCDALEACCPGCYVNAFIYSDYETLTLQLLHEALNIPEDDDILEYWVIDCDFGEDIREVIDENGKTLDIASPEKLYNYIKETYNLCK